VADGERSLAIFIDFENLALGFQGRRERFDIARVLERLVEKGKIVAKKAYADWNRFAGFTAALHEAAIELIEIPRRAQSGKNSADIRLCVDAMDLAYSKEHINTFVVLSGDSDFSPLVSKLKELGKHVIGLGMQESTSDLLRDNCDEFIYYEDLGQNPAVANALDSHLPETKRKAFALLLESLVALRRENKDVLWSSMIKDTMKRKKPSFNETYHGYRTFSELLEDAQQEGLLELETDKRSRTYLVTRFGSEMHSDRAPIPGQAEPHLGPSAASPARPGAMIAVPSRQGSPTAGPSARPVIGPSIAIPGVPAGMTGPEGMMPPGRRKSRRRRRRGQGGIVNGVNGPATAPGAQPLQVPPEAAGASGSTFAAGIELPPPAEAPAAAAEPGPTARTRASEGARAEARPASAGAAPPSEAPAAEKVKAPETKAPAKTRKRATGTRTTRSGTSTRSRKSSASGETAKKSAAAEAAESESEAKPV
jgi:uncharacterized protein (TIGR00288 family)